MAQLLEGDWGAVAQGNMFRPEKLSVVEVAPPLIAVVRYWDLAATEDAGADWTVGLKMGLTRDEQYCLLDIVRVQADAPDVDALIFNTAVLDGRKVDIVLEQEPGSSGKRTIADFVRRLRGYNVRGAASSGSKYERARPFSAQWHAGRVMAVRGAWLTVYRDEMKVFPNPASHDDQVDASSGAFDALTFRRGGRLRAYG
jgi:predicted phage terminase large subunit-like protein